MILQPLGQNGKPTTATGSKTSSPRVLAPLASPSAKTKPKVSPTPTPIQKTQKVLNTPPKKTAPLKLPNGVKLNLVDAQQPASAQMKQNKKTLEATAKSLKQTDAAIKKVQQIFPSTSKAFGDLMIDPLTMKADPKKAWDAALESLKEPLKQEKDRIIKFWEASKKAKNIKEINGGFLGLGSPEIAGKKLEVITGAANVVFSPITALFKAAEHVPVLGTLSKAISIPFSFAGEGATALSGQIVDVLPISEADKKALKPGLQEISALAAQIALGKAGGGKGKAGEIGEISPAKRGELVQKYGLQDALTIETKAKELAKQKAKAIEEGKTYSPEEIRNRVIDSPLENTPEGKALIKASYEAEKQGKQVRVGDDVIDQLTTFEKNIADYQQSPGYTPGVRTIEDAALRDITKQADLPAVKTMTQEKVSQAIKSKEIKLNEDGSISVFRAGEKTNRERIVSATYDRTVAERFAKENNVPISEYKIQPEDIKAFIGKGEKEVLIKNIVETQAPKTPSKIGKSIEQKAIDEQLTKGFDGVAGYDKITIADQAKRTSELLNADFERARRIVRGEEQLPAEIRGTSMITAMEKAIEATKDKKLANELAYELANSKLVSATSEAAQNLRLAAERTPDSLALKLRELREAREQAALKRTGEKSLDSAVKKEVGKIKNETKKTIPKREDWTSFINSIQC